MAVSKEMKEAIKETVNETIKSMNSDLWIERQRAIENETFQKTEKALYSFTTLKEYVEDEEDYLAVIPRGKSCSVIRYSKNRAEKPDENILLEARMASYQRSKNEVERIEKALEKIKDKKGYEVIELRYLQRKTKIENGKKIEEIYTFEEIADILSRKQGYNENLNEKTVRIYKNKLVKDVAISLFGLDAI